MPGSRAGQLDVTMLRALILICLLVLAVPAGAASLGAKLKTVSISGRPYNRLAEWAGLNGFTLSWQVRGKVVVASGKDRRLRFEVDSRKATIDGVEITLAFPVAIRSGEAHVAPLDFEKTIIPLVYPPKLDGAGRIRTICLDPGHGGRDPGNMEGRRREKDYTLLLARELAEQLRNAGFKVVSTRGDDRFVELDARPAFANRHKADLLISLHFNSAAARSADGIEVFCLTPAGAASSYSRPESGGGSAVPGNRKDEENILLAHRVQRAVVKATAADDRGVLRARFAVLRTATMPAILVEGGFMSNPIEGPRIAQSAYRKKIATGIAAGIADYKKVVER